MCLAAVAGFVPRHEPAALPPVDELLAELREAGVSGAPDTGDERALQGFLFCAAEVAQRQKQVGFEGFSWDEPTFSAKDSKMTLRFRFVEFAGSTREELLAALAPKREGELLAVDARNSPLKEFEIAHMLFGEVTLFDFPRRPVESADPRIHAAQEAGWTPTLKEHNLLPGRGIVVLDEHQGLLLREPSFESLRGLFILKGLHHFHLWLNPVAKGADPDLQYWLSWGKGGPASAWREVVRYEGDE